jgi:hypothetical protein
MATLHNVQLAVSTDRLDNLATVVASCDVDFSEFEVNSMNLLGLRYTLACQVLNRDLQYEDPVIRFRDRQLPFDGRTTERTEHVELRSDAVMSDLHEHVFTKDELVAEFTLTNVESGVSDVFRSNVAAVDLVP